MSLARERFWLSRRGGFSNRPLTGRRLEAAAP
jgi:hypothetical protein